MFGQLYLAMLVLGFVVSIVVMLIGLSHRNNPVHLQFATLMALVLLWIVLQAIYLIVGNLEIKYILNELKFISVAFIPVLLWVVILRMFHIKRDPLEVQIIIMAQLLFLGLIATNPSHLLFRYNIRFIPFGPYESLISDYNLGFWCFTAFTYFVMALSLKELIQIIIVGTKNQRQQGYVFLIATLIPVLLNLSFVVLLKSVAEDITPIGFTLTGMMLLYGIFYHKLLDIVIRSRSIIFENIDDIIIIADLQDLILDMNPQATQLLSGIKTGINVGVFIDENMKTTDKNGIYCYAQTTDHEIQFYELDKQDISKRGHAIGSIYYIRNVTEQIELEKALSIQQVLIQKDLDDKGEYIQFLMRHARDDVFRMDSLLLLGTINTPDMKRIADSAISLLKDQISNVESFMSFERGDVTLKIDPTLVLVELRRYFEIIQYEAQKKGLKFVVDIESMPEKANIDMGKLKQVLTNILMNAVKFTEEGLIKVYVRSNEREIIFTISDTGQGMTEEGLAQALLPFVQVSETSYLKGGSGLGLTLVKELVQLMGGKLAIESQVGQGTSVTFQIKYSAFEKRIAKEELGMSIVTEVLKQLDVGLLTDDPLFEAHLRYQLKDYPKSIVSIYGNEIKHARIEQDLYIVDQSWLEQHAEAFIERFEFRLVGHLPMILAAQEMTENTYRPSGNCHVLMKPFMAHELYKLILKIV